MLESLDKHDGVEKAWERAMIESIEGRYKRMNGDNTEMMTPKKKTNTKNC